MKRNLFFIILVVVAFSCKKKEIGDTGGSGGGGGTPQPTPTPVDPPIANTIGFFLNDWTARNFVSPAYTDTVLPIIAATGSVTIDAADVVTKIPKSIFGQNANIWMSQLVTEPVLMNHLTQLHPNLIRFPGGSLSDVYFWNALPNQPPSDAPSTLLDANGATAAAGYWYGKNEESWTLSLNNYYNMLQQTGNQSMITVNYGYARYGTGSDPVAKAAHLAADWVRYDNGRTKYWEIGNESNGTWEAGYRINTATNNDGQPSIITGALYGKHFKVFADSMRKAAQEIGKTIYIGAYLLEKQPESWQTPTDQSWNSGVLAQSNNAADFYIIHSYYTPYQQNSTAAVILNSASDNSAAMMNYVKSGISNAGAMVKPVALTEWNINAEGSMQQVSHINGMHATILLGEALKNKYGEASRWDLANGWNNGNDHGLFNIGDEVGANKWNPRPAFYHMYYFQKWAGDRLLQTTVAGNSLLAYGTSFSSGEKAVVLVNKTTAALTTEVILKNGTVGNRFYWYTLTGGTDNGEFSRKLYVNGRGPAGVSGGPAEYATLRPYSAFARNGIKLTVAPRSVVYLVMDKN